jgi:hypothetical protein
VIHIQGSSELSYRRYPNYSVVKDRIVRTNTQSGANLAALITQY